jgi:UDP-N-acetyl-D-mannosaminuronic acid dehydrogenase
MRAGRRLTGWQLDVAIVGGCGHVGLPLGIALAASGLRTTLVDIDQVRVSLVAAGELPFMESGAADTLREQVAKGTLTATTDAAAVADAESVIVVIGTPIDGHLNPGFSAVPQAVVALAEHLRRGQLLVLRSTVFPGVSRVVEQLVEELELGIDVAFCPERIAEGRAMTELYALPQIVSARTPAAVERAGRLFRRLTASIIELQPEEAELAKLFTNAWRYIKFATANQLFMIADSYGLDYERIRHGLAQDYPRAADLPGAGFAAGPCLLKDTMQLAAFNNNGFFLGHSAMMINEGLPLYVVSRIAAQHDLASMTVGILGMAFKAESDDIRSSLSYKLKHILQFRARQVLCTDPYVTEDPDLQPLEKVVELSDLLVIGAPHRGYTELVTDKPIVDIWNLRNEGVRLCLPESR